MAAATEGAALVQLSNWFGGRVPVTGTTRGGGTKRLAMLRVAPQGTWVISANRQRTERAAEICIVPGTVPGFRGLKGFPRDVTGIRESGLIHREH